MRRVLFSFVASFTVSVAPVQASILDSTLKPVLQPIAKLTLGQFLDQVSKTANEVIGNARAQADGLVVKTANEANITTTNVAIAYRNQLGSTIQDLDAEQQQVVARIQAANLKLKSWVSQAYTFRDTTIVDADEVLDHVPFTRVPEFYVLDVTGASFLHQGSGYHVVLHLRGSGFSSNRTTTIKAELNDKPLVMPDPDQTTLGTVDLTLPTTAVDPLFSSTGLANPKLLVKVNVRKPGLMGIDFLGGTSHDYTVPIFLNLYPDKAGHAVVRSTYPVYAWVGVGNAYGDQISTPDRDGCRSSECEAHNTVTVRVNGPTAGPPQPGSQRIARLSLDCTTGNSICNFQDSVKAVTSLNDTLGTITFNTNSHSVNFRAVAAVQEWRQTGVATKESSGDLYFTKQTQFVIPTASRLDIVAFTSFTKDSYEIPLVGPDPKHTVNFVARSVGAGGPDSDVVLLNAQTPF